MSLDPLASLSSTEKADALQRSRCWQRFRAQDADGLGRDHWGKASGTGDPVDLQLHAFGDFGEDGLLAIPKLLLAGHEHVHPRAARCILDGKFVAAGSPRHHPTHRDRQRIRCRFPRQRADLGDADDRFRSSRHVAIKTRAQPSRHEEQATKKRFHPSHLAAETPGNETSSASFPRSARAPTRTRKSFRPIDSSHDTSSVKQARETGWGASTKRIYTARRG